MILVDTNVLLDVFEDDPEWCDWSQDGLDSASAIDTLTINPVIYSELSIGFARIEELEAVIKTRHWPSRKYLGKPFSWQARRLSDIGAAVEPNAAFCQSSTSAHTPLSCNGPF